ncbi:MAG: putative transport system permease protein, partial [Acidimicrobiaceae bacterium]|nr:putative transport system permease protein [Acidimicrobiaceae bacterium]
VPGGPANGIDNPRIQTVHNLPTVTALPNLLVTEHAVTELGLDVHPGAWLVTAQGRLSATQINVARQTAAAAAMTIETRNQAPSLTQLRDTATAVGILFALGVLSMTVGLLRSETGAERRTLTAVGAPSTTRRTITAATAGGLALVGALLGTAVAYIATAAFFRNQLSQRMSHPPTLDLLLVLVGLPVAAILGGWVFAGREPPAIGRKPIE